MYRAAEAIDHQNQHEKNAEIINPQDTGGIFLPEFDAEVIDIRSTNQLHLQAGEICFQNATFDDGSIYPILVATPKQLRSDAALVSTTAWMTSTKGHNRLTMEETMRLGYKHIMIGPEGEVQNNRLNAVERFKLAQVTGLPRTAYNINRILDHVIRSEDSIRPNEIIALGESRGAMIGFGLGAQQYSGDRRVAYGDLTAPCFPRAAKLHELPGVVAQLAPEAMTLGKLAVRHLGPKLRHYPATLQKDPEYYLQSLLTIKHLLNGDAGKLAKALPKDVPLHIRVFNKDSWSQGKTWESVFAGFHNVAIEYENGCHLDIAHPGTLKNIGKRLTVLASERGFDGNFDSVDFANVLAAHK